jgi:capsular polysaccharide export protein
MRRHRIAAARLAARRARRAGRPTSIFIGFSRWKRGFIRHYLPDAPCVFLDTDGFGIRDEELATIDLFDDPTVYVWSCRYRPAVEELCLRRGIPLVRVEDGFIRSVGLGVEHRAPLSLVFDRRAMHFERDRASDLEEILATRDFAGDPGLMADARTLADLVVGRAISKYNFTGTATSLAELLPSRAGPRVLVLGQVESDMSIRFGMARPMTNAELVHAAAAENPEGVVLYRPHPQSVHTGEEGPASVLPPGCIVIPPSIALEACFAAADKVYTMTSLAGFEAVMRGLPVVTFGMPFYAGWGFTEDRDAVARRTRVLTPLEVFAGAYLLYPRYVDPQTGRRLDAHRAAEVIEAALAREGRVGPR